MGSAVGTSGKRKAPPKLRPHQVEGVQWLRRQHPAWCGLLADSMGVGKTCQALAALQQSRLLPAVIVCPTSTTDSVWLNEVELWCPGLTATVVVGRAGDIEPADVYIIGVDLLWSRLDDLLALRPRLRAMVLDEAHYYKEATALRTHAARVLASQVEGRILLSGTPLVNHGADLQALHAIVLGLPPDEELPDGPPAFIRRYLQDVAPDVPPKRRVSLFCDLPPKYRKEYDQIEKRTGGDWLTAAGYGTHDEEEGDIAGSPLAGEALVRVGRLRRLVGEGKIDAAVRWIAHMVVRGEPVVVFAEFQNVIQAIARRLTRRRIGWVLVDGTVTRQYRRTAVDMFQAGNVPVFLGSQAAREGLTLHRARHLLMVERWWTSASEEQAEDRICRIGQTRETTCWYLHARHSYDERVHEIVSDKRGLVEDAVGIVSVESLGGANEEEMEKAHGSALPSSDHVHAVVFHDAARDQVNSWFRMHNYNPTKKIVRDDRVIIICRPRTDFMAESLREHEIAPGITIVSGRTPPRGARRVVRVKLGPGRGKIRGRRRGA